MGIDIGGNERARAIVRATQGEAISPEDNEACVRVVLRWAARHCAGGAAALELCQALGLDPAALQRRSESVS